MKISDRYFNRVVFAAMTVGFALLLIAAVVAVVAAQEKQRTTMLVIHTYEVERALDKFSILSEQLETARRGYILNHRQVSLDTYHRTVDAIPLQLDHIGRLTHDNPVQQKRLIALRAEAQLHVDSARQTFDRLANPNPAIQAMADFAVDSSFVSMLELRNQIAVMDGEEKRLLDQRMGAQDEASLLLNIVSGIAVALILVIMGGTFWIVLRYTADLNQTQDALRTLNAGLEEGVALRTAELSRANEEIQRFAYIVSHDLRSPLVNVMGFTAELEMAVAPLTVLIDRVDAEAPALMTTEARDAKADVPEAIQFIRTSTAKMDRLINSILRLSREGRRTLAPTPINLGVMLAAIRDTFAHRLGEIGAEIDVHGPFPPLVSDRLAIEQILSNLIENAVKYLQPGRPGRIAVAARSEGRRIIVDVVDNGRGIAPADQERIFELFRRSGIQDQPGEGLGLAHVRALAYRLGGVINCISSLGEGATFRLSLPTILVDLREGPAG